VSRPFLGAQEVTCAECKRTYTCTPEDDYYNADSTTTGLCFSCLLASGGMNPETTPVQVINLDGDGSTDPRDLALKPSDGAP
jgi:hypothetical protein